jgi:hypothetical protein
MKFIKQINFFVIVLISHLLISTSGAVAQTYGINSAGNTNTITNSGTITVSTSGASADAYGIYSNGNTNTISNSGTITVVSTEEDGADAYDIYSNGNTNTITNSGKITAETAIFSNGGSLNILPNSYIDGLFSLTGTTVNITTGPSHSIYYNLGVTPTFSGPTPGFINGTTGAATFDPTVFKGSINELADLNNNIASAANKNLSNFKDRQFSTSVFASQLEKEREKLKKKEIKFNFTTPKKDWSIYGGWVNPFEPINKGRLGSTQEWRIEKPKRHYY